jgi:hypothetical protein
MKLKVKTFKTVKDLETLLNATTGKDIKLALEGWRKVAVKKSTSYEVKHWKNDAWRREEAYLANAN